MKLYYFPGACSLASDIALREAGATFDMVKVDIRTGQSEEGDYKAINPKGYVPALRLDSGELLTENPVILQYIADHSPNAKLAPPAGTVERLRLQEWLGFLNSEVHKSFSPIFSPVATDEVRTFARGNVARRLGWLDGVWGSKQFVMGDQYTVADPYLFTLLSWGDRAGVDLTPYSNLKRFHERVGARPQTLAALKAEGLIK